MERLEAKQVKGHTYYYYSKWAKQDGRCRRVWQRYLGKLEDIVQAVEGGPPAICAEVFQWGLPKALWSECRLAEVIPLVEQCCPKRKQGLTTGQYMAIAAINRAICPQSKRSMWDWFVQTILLRELPNASAEALSSQRFWDHMDRIDRDAAATIWKQLLGGVIRREAVDLSSISYDGTNFYTFIDTFNVRCEIAQRGKNKQGRDHLRQVSYALFCCADGQIPLFYDVYPGNRNDAKQFPQMLQRFHEFFRELSRQPSAPETTVVFDKGNNSEDNFRLLDQLELKFVGSIKLDQHRDLAEVSNQDPRFCPCASGELEGTKAQALETLCDTYLGKNLIVSNRDPWDDERIIRAYRSQFQIENVFKEIKDRGGTGTWWPLNHWTDQKIEVHALYCTIALLLRALLARRVKAAGLTISLARLLSELDGIREVVNIYPPKHRQQERRQTVLTKQSEVQQRLVASLNLQGETTS
jgi:transposase